MKQFIARFRPIAGVLSGTPKGVTRFYGNLISVLGVMAFGWFFGILMGLFIGMHM